MSKKANPRTIGTFVIGAVVLVITAIIVFGSGNLLKKDTVKVVFFFHGSVNGLDLGAPVKLRGVTIGRVAQISLVVDEEKNKLLIPVLAELNPSRVTTPAGKADVLDRKAALESVQRGVEAGLTAQLVPQSLLTGKLFIELSLDKARESDTEDLDLGYPQIPTVPSTADQILDVVRTAVKQFNEIPFDQLLDDTTEIIHAIREIAQSPKIPDTLDNIDSSSRELAVLLRRLNQKLDPALDTFSDAMATFRDMSVSLRDMGNEYTNVARRLDSKIDPLSDDALRTMEQARSALQKAEGLVDNDSPLGYELYNTLRELSQAARSLRTLAQYLERHPDALIKGKAR